MDLKEIEAILGGKTFEKLMHYTPSVSKEKLFHQPKHRMEEIYVHSDRNQNVLNNLERMYGTGRLAGTGYLSI